jgi:hypothetical protein
MMREGSLQGIKIGRTWLVQKSPSMNMLHEPQI